MKKYWYLFFGLSIITIGCQNFNSNPDLIEINIEKNVKNIKHLNICDFNAEIGYVPLKGRSVLLKTIILSDFFENFMMVSDRYNCLICDMSGNLVSKIGQRGKGPGEYYIIENVKFGRNYQVYIQDGNFLIEYDFKGHYLRKFVPEVINSGGVIRSWAPVNDSIFIGQIANNSGIEKYMAALFDSTGKTVGTVNNHIFYLNSDRFSGSTNNSDASIYQLKGHNYFKEKLNDTLFMVNDQYGFKPVYHFNLGKYGTPKEVRGLPLKLKVIESQKYIIVNSVFDVSNYIFLDCNFNNHNPARRSTPLIFKDSFGNEQIWWFFPAGMLGIFNKRSKELLFAEQVKCDDELINDGLHNDYDGGVNFYPRTRVNDSTLAMWVDAYQLKEHVASETFKYSNPKYPEKKKDLQKLANSISENDNPVLILCTFKK